MENKDWKPTVYENYSGQVETVYGTVDYTGYKRDWDLMGNTVEENLALGTVVILTGASEHGNLVAHGIDLDHAIDQLKKTYQFKKEYEDRR